MWMQVTVSKGHVPLKVLNFLFLLPQCQLFVPELRCENSLRGVYWTGTVAIFYVLRYFIEGILTFEVQMVLCQTLDAETPRK